MKLAGELSNVNIDLAGQTLLETINGVWNTTKNAIHLDYSSNYNLQ